jgi:hypothetical protein
MTLYLATAEQHTCMYPGDDGMYDKPVENITRLVEADSAEEAEAKLKAAFERDEPYSISVSLYYVEVHPVIT